MMRIGRFLLIGLGVIIGTPLLLVAIVAIVSRFADGPLVEFLPGGALTTGEWVAAEPADWIFVTNDSVVELESDGRSRKTWILTIDGKAYIPASLGFPPFKTWHRRALEEPDAVVRIAGKRYARRLHKIDDRGLAAQLAQQVRVKYGGVPDENSGAWFFRLDPPF